MSAFDQVSVWYFTVALAFSCYYAYRGYMGNWIAQREANEKRSEKLRLSKSSIVAIFCVHDMLFHFFAALAGFLALHVASILYDDQLARHEWDTGRSLLLVFAFVFGLVGATGQLPQLILQGKPPGLKS